MNSPVKNFVKVLVDNAEVKFQGHKKKEKQKEIEEKEDLDKCARKPV